ncbi:hypothetical protein TIFTF001_026740 [Ficus carica]|uniref:Uncharacterized protein n=1 Tax=Ficus carica TaxID=3494 RepID=A0AA88IYJ9_FICCA|nr:hypothetical protein TIFTF001_026740 [Ficus carica]
MHCSSTRLTAFVHDLGLLVHAVEIDVLNVITTVRGIPSLDDTGVMLDDVCELLASLNGLGLSHIRRSTDHVEHLLSYFAFNFRSLTI